MEVAPPTYEKATSIDVWDIVARYIHSRDLCSAALVCSRWHAAFLPRLWGHPASHFGLDKDRVFVALTRFMRTLRIARLFVRSFTHTLHLPPAHPEIYNGPHSEWLRDVLTWLPNLQSLIVKGLPFFDNDALRALQSHKHTSSPTERDDTFRDTVDSSGSLERPSQQAPNSLPTFRLRVLDASRCSNVTSNSLAQALKRFESLIYLDLSHTAAAKDSGVIEALHRLSGLQVLRMRSVALRDKEVEALAAAIGRRTRSLDLSNNNITDVGLRTLLGTSFAMDRAGSNNMSTCARSPSDIPYLGAEMLDVYQSENFEGFILRSFTARFVSRLAIEDGPEGGITHLYISNNAFTIEGVSSLLRSRKLHVLDIGAIKVLPAQRPIISGLDTSSENWVMSGAERLVQIIHSHAGAELTFLRIDHTLLAEYATNTRPNSVKSERANTQSIRLPGRHKSDGMRRESMSTELSNSPIAPRYELAGDAMHVSVSSAVNQSPCDAVEESDHISGREKSFTTEVVDSNSTPNSTSMLRGKQVTTESNPKTQPHSSVSIGSLPHAPRPRTYSSLAADRQASLKRHIEEHRTLHPAMLPRLRTLNLTNVPAFSSTREVADRLISFVRNCAEESFRAKAQAKFDYAIPPGRVGQASALRESADKLFALKRLVLEAAPPSSAYSRSQSRSWQPSSSKSMTEDEDSDAMWSEAAHDFSFFNDDNDDDGYASPTIEDGEKKVAMTGNAGKSSVHVTTDQTPRIDNIALLSAFRKDRSLAHQRNLAAGNVNAETVGHWDGLIQVVRPSPGLDAVDETDYDGNRYTDDYPYQ